MTDSLPRPRRKSALWNVLLFFFSSAVALLIVEIIVRVVVAAPVSSSIRWSDNIRVFEGPEFRYYIRTNSIGMRDAREFARDSASTRVLFIGDSFTFGNGVSNEDTISAKTEALLNQGSKRSWTVINAGQPGTGTRAEERQLRRVLDLINVDAVVLFYFVDNDPYETVQEFASERASGPPPPAPSSFLRLKSFLTVHSALYRFLRSRLATQGTLRAFPYTIFDQCDPAKTGNFREMDSLMRASVHGMQQLARERNFVFRVVLIPRREQISGAGFEKFKQNYRVGRYPYDRLLPEKRVRENVFLPEGITPLDLMDPLEGADPDKYYYRYDGHFTTEGTSLAAAKVADMIRASVQPKN
jgi:hypothetical protein